MKSVQYQVTLTGETPLLMHADNIAAGEVVARWQKDPANAKKSAAGDDRSPAFRYIAYMYREGGNIVIPSDNLMTVLREGGSKLATGKKGATFKRQTQSGLVVDQVAWPLLLDGSPIPDKLIKNLWDDQEEDFAQHESVAETLGYTLFVKRAKIGEKKHIRVRPRFDNWSIQGSITVLDDTITHDVLSTILEQAGLYAGLCDWRPSSPKSPGSFGKFTSEVKKLK